MKKNIGCFERLIRIVVGIVILGIGYYYKTYWGLLGLLPIVTATVRICPLYTLLKISTYKGDEKCGCSCSCKKK
ncbi:MAG: DUF2892 domain-containing protein [bacterium]